MTVRIAPRRGAPRARRHLHGATMIEILVALVITLLALFAMLGLNIRSIQAESESYQRSQALILVDDMAQRIRANRTQVAAYATPAASAAGDGSGVAVCPAAAGAARDLCQWGNLLRGAAERQAGANVGGMAGARGCIAVQAPAAGASGPVSANVVVVWRGATPTATRAAAPCVPDGFGVGDGFMRYTSSLVRFGDLDGN